MQYRCRATSVDGFIQQVAVAYVARGYWFYVSGRIPPHKDPELVDQKLIARYGVAVSQKERCRRKRGGLANMQYIRHERFFLLMATHGKHEFFDEEDGQVRDARRVPIRYAGYTISHRNRRVCVRIAVDEYARLKAHFLELACRRSEITLAVEFARIRMQPYAPIRAQVLTIWRAVNRTRRAAGYDAVPIEAVPWKRSIVRPFAIAFSNTTKTGRGCSGE
ncbi:MAG: hypothetical protein KF841_02955 [Phycisphaerae bacterium]|nr:hypothetical protein [Phycisphaerae bacterium]